MNPENKEPEVKSEKELLDEFGDRVADLMKEYEQRGIPNEKLLKELHGIKSGWEEIED